MEPCELIRDLVREMAPNTTVIEIDEGRDAYRVHVAGTSGVTAACDLPRAAVASAVRDAWVRDRVAFTLKRCADDVDIRIPDGRE
jgi:hypothetical protein